MTAIVNNARFSSDRGWNFQRSFLSFLSWRISHHLGVNDNYCPWCEWELWTLFSSPPLESNVAVQQQSAGCDWSTQCGGRALFFFFFGGVGWVWKKTGGQESKWEWHLPSVEACFMPAIDAPFPKVSLQGGRSALQIGSALALFTSGQAGRGTVPTHTPSVIPPPPNLQPPTNPPNLSSPKRPQS